MGRNGKDCGKILQLNIAGQLRTAAYVRWCCICAAVLHRCSDAAPGKTGLLWNCKRPVSNVSEGTGILFCILFPVLLWRHSHGFLKHLRKIGLGRKSCAGSYLGNGVVRIDQKFHAGLQTLGRKVTNRRLPNAAGEGMGQIIFVDMGEFRKGIQGDVLRIIGIYVALGQGAFLGNPEGGVGNYGQIYFPGYKNKENLQNTLANDVEARLLCTELFQHKLGIIRQTVLGGSITVMAVAFPVFIILSAMEGESQSIHAENEIFHRVMGHCFFRMFHMGVNDDQVIGFDRYDVVFYMEHTASAYNIEKFRKMVGVGKALPIPFVF